MDLDDTASKKKLKRWNYSLYISNTQVQIVGRRSCWRVYDLLLFIFTYTKIYSSNKISFDFNTLYIKKKIENFKNNMWKSNSKFSPN